MDSLESIFSATPPAVAEIRGEPEQSAPRESEPKEQRDADSEKLEAKPQEPVTGDVDGDDADEEYDPNDLRVEGLRKALNSQRSQAKKFRGESKANAARVRELEAKIHELTGHVSALHQQRPAQAPESQEKKPEAQDVWSEFYTKGPDFVRAEVQNAIQADREAQRRVAVAQKASHIDQLTAAFVAKHEDAQEHLNYFSSRAAKDRDLAAKFALVVDSGHPDPIKWAYDTAKAARKLSGYASIDDYEKALREKWEAEVKNGSGQQVNGNASAPRPVLRTLAGSRSGGAGVTRVSSQHVPLQELFG